MLLKKLEVGMLGTNCYIIGCPQTKVGAVIDPGDEGERIIQQLKQQQIKCDYIILTHGHPDHISALVDVRDFTGAAVLMHENDAHRLSAVPRSALLNTGYKKLNDADRYLKDGDVVAVGQIKLEVLHTPGHSPGGICLGVDDILFTGDTLFYGSVGRSDFPGGDHAQLIHSIKTKLLTRPDATKVYPGHGPATTIGTEKKINPFLR